MATYIDRERNTQIYIYYHDVFYDLNTESEYKNVVHYVTEMLINWTDIRK